MSVQLAAQDFTTPDKGGPTKMPPTHTPATAFAQQTTAPFSSVTPAGPADLGVVKKVTPNMTTSGGKHVRFGAEDTTTTATTTSTAGNDDASAANNKRGLVSRRGGRYVSPGRPPIVTSGGTTTATTTPTVPAVTPKEASVLEYKTFRGNTPGGENTTTTTTTTPAISTTNSVGLVSLPSSEGDNNINKEKETPQKSEVKAKLDEFETTTATTAQEQPATTRPSSITCASTIGPTSPLARTSSPQKDSSSFEVRSPVPSTSTDRFKKTPTKSPSHFQSLPSLDDPKLGSPVGFMLSPGPGTPSYKAIRDSLEKEDKEAAEAALGGIRDYTKEKFALTPTNFSTDYGKSSGTNFDTSNVLNWLQSPTANGLFSPGGGLSSIMNTPKGPLVPRTPGTPTVSTSFFFSDVAGLARNGDTPKKDGELVKSPKKGLSNIICISPLASTRHRHGGPNATKSPINYHDIFASPNPLLDDSPPGKGLTKRTVSGQKSKKDPSVDAMTLAEKDLMQDEDLSVLLQLAGGNTPKPLTDRHSKTNSPSGRVFRPSGSRKGDDQENLPALQIPMIGDRQGDSTSTRLSRKTHPREDAAGGVVKPTIGIRKSSSHAHDADMFAQNELERASKMAAHPGKPVGSNDDVNASSATKEPEGKPAASTGPQPYAVHSRAYPHRPPPSDMYGYPAFPPSGMRPSGRMSVVVGGPPPSSRSSKASPAPRAHLPPHRRPSYGHSEYPAPGMYPHPPPHGHPYHHVHMGSHYASHYSAPPPPPRHHQPPPASRMPVYPPPPQHQPRQHHPAPHPPPQPKITPKAKPTPKSAPVKRPPLPSKRPSITAEAPKPPPKKQKKSPPKKKNKSPQLTEKADRQRAAQTIAAVNAASGGKNDKAAALAAAILRGVTMRPSGKWQAQLYFAGKSRYIGVFDTREKAALAYEIAREKLKSEKSAVDGALTPKQTENAVNAARKAAFDGVNEKG